MVKNLRPNLSSTKVNASQCKVGASQCKLNARPKVASTCDLIWPGLYKSNKKTSWLFGLEAVHLDSKLCLIRNLVVLLENSK